MVSTLKLSLIKNAMAAVVSASMLLSAQGVAGAAVTPGPSDVVASETMSAVGADAECGAAVEGAVQFLKVEGRDARAVTDVVLHAVAEQRVNTQVDLAALDLSNVKVYGSENDNATSVVTYPIVAEGMSAPLSNITVVLQDGAITQYAEPHLQKSESGTFQVSSFVDGVAQGVSDTGITWMNDAELASALRGEASALDNAALPIEAQGFSAKKKCVAAVLGVSTVVAGIIVTLCGGSCATAATNPASATVCAACIGGIATVGSAAIAATFGCFKL